MTMNILPTASRSRLFQEVAVNFLGLAAALGIAGLLARALLEGQWGMVRALVGLAAALMTIALDNRIGLLVWLALAPLDRYLTLSMGSGIPDLGLSRLAPMLLVFLLIAQVATGRRRLARVTPLDVAGGLFILAMIASAPRSWMSMFSAAQTLFDTVVIPLLVYLFARTLSDKPRSVRWLVVAVTLVIVPLALIAGQEQLTGYTVLSPLRYNEWAYGRFSRKVTSVFGAPAIMALTLSVAAPILLYATVQAKKLGHRLVWGGALAIDLLGGFLTYVRGGWLGAVAGMGVLFVLSRRTRRYLPHLLLIALVLAAVLYGPVIDPRALRERVQSEQPIEYRLESLDLAWQFFKKSPVLGIGFDNFGRAAQTAGWMPHELTFVLPTPHNTYVYILTSAGLVGLLPFLAILGLILGEIFRLWRQPGTSRDLLAMLAGTLIGYGLTIGAFDALNARYANMLFFLIVGTVLGSQTRAAREARG